MEQGLSVPEIISECCELFHINRSGPGFLRHRIYLKVLRRHRSVTSEDEQACH